MQCSFLSKMLCIKMPINFLSCLLLKQKGLCSCGRKAGVKQTLGTQGRTSNQKKIYLGQLVLDNFFGCLKIAIL